MVWDSKLGIAANMMSIHNTREQNIGNGKEKENLRAPLSQFRILPNVCKIKNRDY